MRDTFSEYHPAVNFLYFGLVIGFSMLIMHPACLFVSLFSASLYNIRIKGKKALKRNLLYILPLMFLTAIINPLFNHEGQTIIAYFSSGNPLTLESVIYGIAAAMMLFSVLFWFICFNAIITSDKFVYLFGRMMPALSLILSMTLRFVPRFKLQIITVAQAQKGIGNDIGSGNIIMRAKQGITILSSTVTWALENAIETSDSMKSRGYGIPGRTAFSIYRFGRRDIHMMSYLIFCGAYIIAGITQKALYWRYFPSVGGNIANAYSISLIACYFALCILPVVLNIKEDKKWNALKSGI